MELEAYLEAHDCLPPLPPHITLSFTPKVLHRPVSQEEVLEALRALSRGGRKVRVAEVVHRCFDSDYLDERYSKAHIKTYFKLRKLANAGKAERAGFADYEGREGLRPSLWRAKEDE